MSLLITLTVFLPAPLIIHGGGGEEHGKPQKKSLGSDKTLESNPPPMFFEEAFSSCSAPIRDFDLTERRQSPPSGARTTFQQRRASSSLNQCVSSASLLPVWTLSTV